MKERTKFALEWEKRWKTQEGRVNTSELCRVFGISRQTGHQWIKRYRDGGYELEALRERSRRPLHSPTMISEDVLDRVISARKARPKWGPRKLRAWLIDRYPGTPVPSASSIGNVLKRQGLARPRKRKRSASPSDLPRCAPFAGVTAPNDVWCFDFKGKFRTRDGHWCHVLTVVDAYSRYLIRCEGVQNPTGKEVERICDSAFQEYGLPRAIRSDNGPPFASTGAGGMTQLSIWWLRLGIKLERIEPGKPQQNGRQERLHRSLVEELIHSPAKDIRAQQRALELWRHQYNQERPHEALGMKAPASSYEVARERRYPRKLREPERSPWAVLCPVQRDGSIRFRRSNYFISTAFHGEKIELEPTDHENKFEVRYGPLLLGEIDESSASRRLLRSRRHPEKLSGISLV